MGARVLNHFIDQIERGALNELEEKLDTIQSQIDSLTETIEDLREKFTEN